MSKEALLEIIAALPEEFSVDELIKRLRINDMVNEAIEDYRAGNYFTDEEVREEIKQMKARYPMNAA